MVENSETYCEIDLQKGGGYEKVTCVGRRKKRENNSPFFFPSVLIGKKHRWIKLWNYSTGRRKKRESLPRRKKFKPLRGGKKTLSTEKEKEKKLKSLKILNDVGTN